MDTPKFGLDYTTVKVFERWSPVLWQMANNQGNLPKDSISPEHKSLLDRKILLALLNTNGNGDESLIEGRLAEVVSIRYEIRSLVIGRNSRETYMAILYQVESVRATGGRSIDLGPWTLVASWTQRREGHLGGGTASPSPARSSRSVLEAAEKNRPGGAHCPTMILFQAAVPAALHACNMMLFMMDEWNTLSHGLQVRFHATASLV
ncbi:hypothetical protein JB92DRAFT_2834926 [Gautieria morchelliformis]|nr:hypothetical protein JB92DRAFT_2834926 [Gautieria morchelliformis]